MKHMRRATRRTARKFAASMVILFMLLQTVAPAILLAPNTAVADDVVAPATEMAVEAVIEEPDPIEEPAVPTEEPDPVEESADTPAIEEPVLAPSEEPTEPAEPTVPTETPLTEEEALAETPEVTEPTETPVTEETPAEPTEPADESGSGDIPDEPTVEAEGEASVEKIGKPAPVEGLSSPVSKDILEAAGVSGSVCADDFGAVLGNASPVWNIDGDAAETLSPVALGVEYVFPLDTDVRVTFTCLPKDTALRAPLRIERIDASDLSLPQGMTAASAYAYDITTDGMENGTFEYDLVLPKTDTDGVEVRYIEQSVAEVVVDKLTENELKSVDENKVEEDADSVMVTELNHFTLFIVVNGVDLTVSGSFNDATQVTVTPNTAIEVDLTVQRSGSNSENDWESTSWRVDSGSWNCVDTPDHVSGSSTDTESFNITAPGSDGTYDVGFRAHRDGSCGNAGVSNIFTLTDGIIVESVDNPDLPETCGLDIALVLDNSGSISSGELATMKTAMIGFVNALAGTPTEFSVTRFGTTASVVQAFTGDTADVISAINSVPVNGGSTNWEDGLLKAKSTLPNRSNFDLVVFASDGNPNRVNNGASVSETQAVAEAVLVADDIKSDGARILALGIGNDLDTANLQAISGPTVNAGNIVDSDVVTSDFSELAADLSAFAEATCGGTITARKMVDGIPTVGWTFAIHGRDYVTDSNGFIQAVEVDPGTYAVTETVQPGHSFVSASCSGATENGQSDGVDGVNGIVVDNNDIVTCTFNNALDKTDLSLTKSDSPDPVVNGGQLTYTLTIRNLTGIPATNVIVADTLPVGFTPTSVAASQGNCSDQSLPNPVRCELGTLAGDASATMTIVGTVSTTNAKITNSAVVTTMTPETTADNNNDSEDTIVVQNGSVKVNKMTDSNGDGDYNDAGEGLNGAASLVFTWSLDGSGTNVVGSTVNDVSTGSHEVNESGQAGYHFVGWFPTGSTQYTCANPQGTTLPISVTVASGQTAEITLCNARDTGTIVIVKDAVPNDAQDFSFSGTNGLGNFSLDDDANGTLSNTKTFTSVPTGTYAVSEGAVAGWAQTSATCSDQSPVSDISLQTGETVTCTFTNTKKSNIVIVKNAINNHAQDFTFHDNFGNSHPDTFILDDDNGAAGANGTYPSSRTFEVLPGTYAVSEDAVAGWQQESATCDQGETIESIDVAAGETVTCTFTNEQYSAITLVKNAVGGNDTFDFDATGAGLSTDIDLVTVGGTASQTFSGLDQDNTYTITENVPAGWNLTSATCNNGETINSIDLEPGETVTCTFTNTKRGSIIIEKQTNPDGNQQSFEFNPSWSGANFFLTDGGQQATALVPGNYSVAELVPNDWTQTSAFCSDQSPVNAISLQAGETVTCVFTNTKKGKITVVKDAVNDDAEDFRFTTSFDTNPNQGGTQLAFDLDDDNNNQLQNTRDFFLVPGEYTIQENIEADWRLTGLSCTDVNNSSVNLGTRTATLALEVGEEITCTFANTKLGKIEGYKWNDKSGDGDLDFDEEKLNGWKIFIDQDDSGTYTDGEPSHTTNGQFWFFGWHDSGEYSFDNLLPGTYTVCEELQDNWYNSTPVCRTVDIVPGETENISFGNHRTMKIKASKIVCTDEKDLPNWGLGGPNITASTAQNWVNSHKGCSLVSDWKFQWSYDGIPNPGDNNTGDPLPDWITFGPTNGSGVTETDISDLKGDGRLWVREVYQSDYVPFAYGVSGNVSNVSAEMYCHTDVINYDNWEWIDDPKYDSTYHCIAWNVLKPGEVVVTKFEDVDGDGILDDGEPTLPGWEMDLSGTRRTTGGDGTTTFGGVIPGSYSLSERIGEDQSDWEQTGMYCGMPPTDEEEENPRQDEARILQDNGNGAIPVFVGPGETVNCYVGNENLGTLTIEKTNDSGYPATKNPGDTVEYRLTITANGGKVKGVTVTDLPPEVAKYVSGSAAGAPFVKEYASPGIWDLGDLDEGETVTLTYDAIIGSDADAGDYPDLAFARGFGQGGDILALAGTEGNLGEEDYVGTLIAIADTTTPPSVKVKTDFDEVIEEVEERETLPATGASVLWIAIAAVMAVLGATLLVVGYRMRNGKSFGSGKAGKVFVVMAIGMMMGLVDVETVRADTPSANLLVRAEAPEPAANNSFILDFVVLDTVGEEDIVAECQVKAPASATFATFASLPITKGGDSAQCSIGAAEMPDDGTYVFRVVASTDSDLATSTEKLVSYDSTLPGRPRYIERDEETDCRNEITFRTADDGQTIRAEVYRENDEDYTADASTKIRDIAIGPDTKYEFDDILPDSLCDKENYYAVRAFDIAGNASPIRVEEVDEVVERTVRTTETVVLTPGAPTTAAAGAEEATTGVGEETRAAGEAGAVAGEEVEEGQVEGVSSEKGWSSWLTWLLGAAVAVVLAFLYRRKKERRERADVIE